MYRNSEFDDCIRLSREGKPFPNVVLRVLYNYKNQILDTETNPFNILMLKDVDFNTIDVAESLLDFLYSAGVKQIVWADESTASIRSLSLMIAIRKYRVNVLDSVMWKGHFNTDNYGLVLEIVKRRK